MGIKLYVDDERPCPDGWVLARTYAEAIKLIHGRGVAEISLDHDLGEDKTGYSLACAIETMAYEDDSYAPPTIHVHTANPVGRQNIEHVIAAIQRTIKTRK